METKIEQTKVQLNQSFCYTVQDQELRRFYITLALIQYPSTRHPFYNESSLFKRLSSDFKTKVSDLHALCQKLPDSHTVHKLLDFFNAHHNTLLKIISADKAAAALAVGDEDVATLAAASES